MDAVQTLSRLNRTFPGKSQDDVFVLDFVNDPEEIKASFAPYYRTTLLAETSEPNLVYDLFEKLRDARIYEWHEVEAFAERVLRPEGPAAEPADALPAGGGPVPGAACRPRASVAAAPARRRTRRWRASDEVAAENARSEQREAGEQLDALETFRSDLRGFLRFYEFMSQVIAFDDPDLEKLSVFGRNLLPMLPRDPEDDAVGGPGQCAAHGVPPEQAARAGDRPGRRRRREGRDQPGHGHGAGGRGGVAVGASREAQRHLRQRPHRRRPALVRRDDPPEGREQRAA